MQQALWHDTIYDALRALIDGLGGPKRVAATLWPAREVGDGQRYLLKCLDSERPEKLGLEEFVWLMRAGREAGCHVLADHLAQACLYEIRPADPAVIEQQVAAELERTMAAASDLLRQWERIKGRRP